MRRCGPSGPSSGKTTPYCLLCAVGVGLLNREHHRVSLFLGGWKLGEIGVISDLAGALNTLNSALVSATSAVGRSRRGTAQLFPGYAESSRSAKGDNSPNSPRIKSPKSPATGEFVNPAEFLDSGCAEIRKLISALVSEVSDPGIATPIRRDLSRLALRFCEPRRIPPFPTDAPTASIRHDYARLRT